MAISKSTPYVRYKKDFTSSLHLGTIHIESEYLDRTQKTTIESIHGMTWHNKVVNENKELNLLSDTQLELTELEKQYWNTGEKRVSVDEIHTLEEVEPNEDGTYTYTVNSMEGEYIEIYDGINNITSISDGLDGQFEIVYDTTEEDINGNIALDSIVPQYEITDSGVGTVTSAKSTGLTLVNHITESSKEEVIAIGEYEGQYFTIENTVQGNIKSAILKGKTLVNLCKTSGKDLVYTNTNSTTTLNHPIEKNKWYYMIINVKQNTFEKPFRFSGWSFANGCKKMEGSQIGTNDIDLFNARETGVKGFKLGYSEIVDGLGETLIMFVAKSNGETLTGEVVYDIMFIEYQEGMENWDIPYFEGMQSVKMPVLTTIGKNLFDGVLANGSLGDGSGNVVGGNSPIHKHTQNYIKVEPNTDLGIYYETDSYSGVSKMYFYDKTKNYLELNKDISLSSGNVSKIIRIPENNNIHYMRIRFFSTNSTDEVKPKNIMITKTSNIITSYEPHKSNILTVNEEVELRGIGEVQDELDLMTGELTQRVRQFALNKTLNDKNVNITKSVAGTTTNTNSYLIYDSTLLAETKGGICDTLPTVNLNDDVTGIVFGRGGLGSLFIKTTTDITTVEQFKEWLIKSDATVVVPKAESVKTVDLTIQNQDGSTIPHIQTQQGITYVSTSSDGLTPVVEMSCSYDTIIKPNTTYTIKLDRPIVSDTMYLQVDLGGTMMMLDADVNAFTIKTPSTLSHSQLRLSGAGNTVKEIIVLEGNRVNDKIEYFEGMKNVENPILIVSNCPYVFGKGGRL